MVRTEQQMARAAGRLVGRWLPKAKPAGKMAKQWVPTARQSGLFVRHVLPAAFKPLHSLWHEILGFSFIVLACLGVWKIWSHPGPLPPLQLAIVLIFIVVMASYGVSSIRKSRRITRS
ncbi:MAG: hypothetical protein M3N54_11815 [Acidobacteriota bacterium]|nr:hypothetical protein [Acidobacteriota bacterium]